MARADWQTERYFEALKDAKVRGYLFEQQNYIGRDDSAVCRWMLELRRESVGKAGMNLRANWQTEQYSEEVKDTKVRPISATELYLKTMNDGILH